MGYKLAYKAPAWRKSVFSKLRNQLKLILTPSGREFYARGHPDGAPSPLPLLPRGLDFMFFSSLWLIKPFTMFGIAYLFFFVIFRGLIPAELATDYLAGAVLLGAAPCTAMVFVWSHLTKGKTYNPNLPQNGLCFRHSSLSSSSRQQALPSSSASTDENTGRFEVGTIFEATGRDVTRRSIVAMLIALA